MTSETVETAQATAFAPGSIGNVGPGFDVLGLAFDGAGDTVTVRLTDEPARIESITGRDAELITSDPVRNTAAIGASEWLRARGDHRNPVVSIVKGLPLSGGMGGSAASSVAGVYAAALARGDDPSPNEVIAAALEAEMVASGRHLDNIATSVYGGLTISRSVDPIDVIPVTVAEAWWVALVTPAVRIETRAARAMLPMEWPREKWIQQMANTTALAHAFAAGDGNLLSRALDDLYAEPHRSALIPHFREIKEAAIHSGAFGCSISGSGPTVFAVCANETVAAKSAAAMQQALGEIASTKHAAPIARKGVRPA